MEYAHKVYMPSGASAEPVMPEMRCLPGKVAVSMLPKREEYGGLVLPDEVKGRLRPDVGVVCSVGAPKMTQKGVPGHTCHLMRGDRVAVRAGSGLWDEDTWEGADMRFFGGGHSGGVFHVTPWWDDIVLVQMGVACCRDTRIGEWLPTGDNLLVKRKRDERPLVQLEAWLDEGMILAAGPYADQSIVGMNVSWRHHRWDDVLTLDGEGYDDSLVVVPGYVPILASEPVYA